MLRKKGNRYLNHRTNLFGFLNLVVMLIGILLYYTNERQNEQVLNSYCSDFGFGRKSLALMKDGTFRFSYSGCSQNNGYVSGQWSLRADILEFHPTEPDDFLDSKYKQVNNRLLPVNIKDEEFILCEDYVSSWERLTDEKIDI